MNTASKTETENFHAVKFYENAESLCRIVSEFLGEGLIRKQPGLVIASPEHRTGILKELQARGFDVQNLQERGDLLVLDASLELAKFMVDGMPDAERFHDASVASIGRLCAGRRDCTVRAYGEMVDVLWKAGQEAASIRLEMLWNKLAMTHDFSLLCGYAMGSFYKDANLEAIHHQHSHVFAGDRMTSSARRSTVN
jgi:hypothetical protein